MTFEAAGPDQDLRDAYEASVIDDALRRGEELLQHAMTSAVGDAISAEKEARTALAEFASALNWSDDGPRAAYVHKRVDAAGRWVRETFGCSVHQEGEKYFWACPVRLGHHRVGFSIGGRARRACSLCGRDLSECPHMRGTAYLVPGGRGDLEWCRVCLSREGCDHDPDTTYRVSVVSIVTDLVVDEISLVDVPGSPGARVLKQEIDVADLQETLGLAWSPGMPVSCDFCLTECPGLT